MKLGTIRGRHEMPVFEYVLDFVENPSDMKAIKKAVDSRMDALFSATEYSTYDWALDCAYVYDESCVLRNTEDLDLYVTGLTAVTTAIIAWCGSHGVRTTLWHFDASSGTYVPQRIW